MSSGTRFRPLWLGCAALIGALCAVALGASVASASSNVTFTIVNPSGTPQFSYYIVLSSGAGPPIASDWYTASSTTTPGQATIAVSAGDTVYFNRTEDVSDKNGTLVPPEGVSGQAYQVTASTPSGVTVTLPTTGAAYNPGLSGSEEWLLGQINQRRVQAGAAALQVSTTLDAAASEEARDEALNGRWPDPYFFVINQDFGWPGDIANETYATADAPYSDPQRVLTHWDGDPSDPESPGIWQALSDPSLKYAGIADGSGAWIIQATDSCPDTSDLPACGFTTDTGDTSAWSPTQIAIGTPASGSTYTQGQSVAASYTCTAPSNGAAVASCAGPVATGQPIDTSGTGTHTFAVTATDVNGDTTTRSVQYDVAAAPPSNSSPPSISGTAAVGQQLTGSPGTWTGSQPITYSYNFQRCRSATDTSTCVDASGSREVNQPYTLTSADAGYYMRFQIYATNSAGDAPLAYSSPTALVQGSVSPPVNVTRASISGTPKVGQKLTAAPGQWTGAPPIAYRYDWRRCADNVVAHCSSVQAGASATYIIQPGDGGSRILVVVTASNGAGPSSTPSISPSTDVIPVPPPPPPAPGCTQKLTFGPLQVTGGCLHQQGLTWVSSGSVSFAGIHLVPNNAQAKIVIDPLNLRVEATGSVSVELGPATVAGHTFGPYTLFSGGFDWIFQGQVNQALTNRLYDALGKLDGGGKGGGVPSYPAFGFPPAIVKLPDLSGIPAIPKLPGLGIPDFSRIASAKQLSELAGLGSNPIAIPGLGGATVAFPRTLIPDVNLPQTCVTTDQVPFIGGLGLQGQACVTIADNIAKIAANVDLGKLLAHTSAKVALTVSPDGNVVIDNAAGQVGEFALGPVKFDQTNFRYDGANDFWHADAGATLGFFGNASLKSSLDVQDGQIKNGSIELNGGQFGVPIGPGFVFNDLGLNVHTTPAPTTLGGTLGFGFGPRVGSGPALQLNGNATAIFGANPSLDVKAQLSALGSTVGTGQFDYSSDTGKISAQLNASYTTSTVNLGLLGSHSARIEGALSGFFQQGQFQVDGGATLTLDPGPNAHILAHVAATVSNVGIAACGQAGWGVFQGNAGVGYKFATHKFDGWFGGGSCGLSKWQIRPTAAAATAGAGARVVLIPAGQRETSLAFRGQGGAPEFVLSGPGGRRITTSATQPLEIERQQLVLVDPANDLTTIILAHPPAGRWVATPQPGSVPIASIATAHALPDPAVRATVTHPHRGRYILTYHLHPLAGQRVTFREQSSSVVHILGSTDAAAGRIEFTPAPGSAGRRAIIASVTQDQLPREQKTVARYIAPKVRRLLAPRDARVYRIRARVRVSWRPVAGAARYLVTVQYNSGVSRQLETRSAKVILGGVLVNDPVSATIVAISATGQRGAAARARAARHLPKPHHPRRHRKPGRHRKP